MTYAITCSASIPALRELDTESAHALCTSVPYWRQRKYEVTGAYGQETTREEWADNQVAVLHEARRVLRDDATAFVVVGETSTTRKSDNMQAGEISLQGPYLAEKLRADGWFVKALVVIEFTNRPPVPFYNRPAQSHEYGILLAKNANDYFWDYLSSRERGLKYDRLLRSVWTGPTEAVYETPKVKFKHTSIFPRWIPDHYLSGAVSQGGVCRACGTPRLPKIKEATGGSKGQSWHDHANDAVRGNAKTTSSQGYCPASITGWKSGCKCKKTEDGQSLVIDPFAGTSTTGVVAMTRGCRYWGVDIDPRCVRVSKERLAAHAEELKTPLFDSVLAAQRQKSMFAEAEE